MNSLNGLPVCPDCGGVGLSACVCDIRRQRVADLDVLIAEAEATLADLKAARAEAARNAPPG